VELSVAGVISIYLFKELQMFLYPDINQDKLLLTHSLMKNNNKMGGARSKSIIKRQAVSSNKSRPAGRAGKIGTNRLQRTLP
jgi:hypothetical protein